MSHSSDEYRYSTRSHEAQKVVSRILESWLYPETEQPPPLRNMREIAERELCKLVEVMERRRKGLEALS
jgi:hypothetical protein